MQLAKHRASGDTALLMGWMRLHALLYACEPEVRRLVRRSVNDWLAHRGEAAQMATREVRALSCDLSCKSSRYSDCATLVAL